jgi:ferric-dicitrate binding protein FerR (iron transport regulator)
MVKQVSLPDGSSIELSVNSELYYEEAFGQQKREIWLTGKAFFKVAKDSTRPFTVYSRELSTTALGTSFTITAYPDSVGVKVVLHTGKVVVKQTGGKQLAAMKPVYLTPGQELLCNMMSGMASVKQTPQNELVQQKSAIPFGARTGFTITFDQQPLADVLDSIAKGYAVNIKYDRESMKDMVFTGIIRKTDSLSQVLQRMAALHNLKIVSTAKGYNVYSNL